MKTMGKKKTLQTMIKSQNLHTKVVKTKRFFYEKKGKIIYFSKKKLEIF
jgi:hypothetical protein